MKAVFEPFLKQQSQIVKSVEKPLGSESREIEFGFKTHLIAAPADQATPWGGHRKGTPRR